MSDDEYVDIPNVEAISDGLALICQIPGMKYRVSIPYAAIGAKSQIQRAGNRGTLIIKKFVADELGLI